MMSLIDDAFALITAGSRSISFLVPDVTIRETSRDELVVTDHPVERGAAISDHAFLRPVEIEMQVAWSDSSAGFIGYSRAVYAELLALQKAREPFSVTTGKRAYSNMLLSTLSTTTDEKSEHILLVTARLREVIIVSTQTTGAAKSAQADPAKTGGTAQRGTQQLKTASNGRLVGPV